MDEFGRGLTPTSSAASKTRLRNVLWRVMIVFGCAILLTSVLNSFLDAHWIGPRIPESFSSWPWEMWSFKQHFYYWHMFSPTLAHVERSFGQYWFQDWDGVASWTGYALMLMLVLQVLTIVLGIFVIFKSTRSSILLPALLNSMIVILIIVISNGMAEDYARTFQPGFWLTLLSIAPFPFAAAVYYCLCKHSSSIAVDDSPS